ncbi:endonuclease domain-containing protein [Phocaeicola sp.]|jgi:very-short-patch-repair endonuclease|uniref:endonuclease domain-containing protein n=1 Tax=Phocaeicola sp. TaxID=2773926 RepID=UPI002050E70E|nr:DUF559 domain-containing protein [Phocaeicola sp.]DAX44010.1 MAG TPA: endonuclease [Caudoviricetes sp.]
MRNELKVWAKSVKDKRNKWIDKNRENLLAHSTKEESILYNNLPKCIKDKCIRQKSITIGNHIYFYDIYIKTSKIAVEIDGGYHSLNKDYDKQRDYLSLKKGITTIRVTNEQVINSEALNDIINHIRAIHYGKLNKKNRLYH